MELRPAAGEDVAYLARLGAHPAVEPFLAPGAAEEARLQEALEEGASLGEPFGLFVIELDDGEQVGGVSLRQASAHSRICNLRQLMVDPAARRRGVGTEAVRLVCQRALIEHDAHRVQTESYGDNHAAHRVFERVGFAREGVRRCAYWRRGGWIDGVLYGILAGELK